MGSDYPFPLGEHFPGKLIESIEEWDVSLKVDISYYISIRVYVIINLLILRTSCLARTRLNFWVWIPHILKHETQTLLF